MSLTTIGLLFIIMALVWLYNNVLILTTLFALLGIIFIVLGERARERANEEEWEEWKDSFRFDGE